MRVSFLLLLSALFFSCGSSKTKTPETIPGCTRQNTSSNQIIISCVVKNKDLVSSEKCAPSDVDDAVCKLGFDHQCSAGRLNDIAGAYPNVVAGNLVLINRDTSKNLTFLKVTTHSSGEEYYLLQHQDGTSVSLPTCVGGVL